MEYILKTNNLTKVFNGNEVIKNVNLSVKKGEIYALLGPNGAGKTTIMKMITNLVKPSMGQIEIFNEVLTNKSYEILKRMGAIIEYPVFYDKLTARENLELHCEYMGYYNFDEIDKVLKLVKLTNVEEKKVKEFSLGMKQRLGIARAIITKPEFVILDEPINGLDPEGIKEVRNLLKLLSKEYGMTIIISSHILAEIEQMADTIGIIVEGNLVEEISMKELESLNTEYIELKVDDYKKASYILENNLRINNFKVMDEEMIRIYEPSISPKELSKELVLNDIFIEEIVKKNTSLEDHFLKLVKGDGIDV